MAAQSNVDIGGMVRPAGTLDPLAALRPHAGRLGERAAAHLLRRAGFGAEPGELRRFAGMSVDEAAEALVHFPSTAQLPAFGKLFDPANRGAMQMDGAMTDRAMLAKKIVGRERLSIGAMQVWWLDRMLNTPAPLQEKMAFFFHGHFTTAAIKKNVTPPMVIAQNQLFRDMALGNLRELTRNVSRGAAMLRYLDGAVNVAAHPNENYARELMELFTLGVNQYGERDVRESARAWTGWRVRRGQVLFNGALHDGGTKTFLGRTGNLTGDDVVDVIFAQPQCARFFAAALLNLFVYNDPEPALVDGVAALLRKHDYTLAPVVGAILRSQVFYSDRAYRALVKSPVEFVVGAYKTLGLSTIDPTVLPALRQMGQVLFEPPNVAGWPGGANWLTSGTMIARQNFVAGLTGSQTFAQSSWLSSVPMQPSGAARALVGTILQDDASEDARAQLEAFLRGTGSSELAALSPENFGERIGGAAYLTLAMPAYQLN